MTPIPLLDIEDAIIAASTAPHGFALPMAEYDARLALFDLAKRKGYDVTQSTMRDHVRLTDGESNLVKNKNGVAAHSYAEARRYLQGLPD